ELAEAQLRAGQVAEDPDLTAHLLADRADPAHVLRLLLPRAMREVEPEDVDAGGEQFAQDLRRAAGRPDSRDDLGATCVIRGCAARRNPICSRGRHHDWPEGRARGTGVGAGGTESGSV